MTAPRGQGTDPSSHTTQVTAAAPSPGTSYSRQTDLLVPQAGRILPLLLAFFTPFFPFCPIFIFETLREPHINCSLKKVIKLFLGRELI